MKKYSFLLFFTVISLSAYSQGCTDSFNSPEAAAEKIIGYTNQENQTALQCLFTAENLEKYSSKKDWKYFFQSGKELFDGVSSIEEIKLGPPLDGKFAFLCKVKEDGDHVVVMLISEKKGSYYFEDITNIPTEHYEKMPSL